MTTRTLLALALAGAVAGLAAATPPEPPVKVEASLNAAAGGRATRGVTAGAVETTSGPAGTKLKLATHGSMSGSWSLDFKSGPPPMRFTLTLTRMPNYDLSTLTLTSGKLSLPVGRVSTAAATKYFDAKGREQAGAAGAAYTIQAKRTSNGDIDIQLRRGRGAALEKSLGLSWESEYGVRRLGGRGLIEK